MNQSNFCQNPINCRHNYLCLYRDLPHTLNNLFSAQTKHIIAIYYNPPQWVSYCDCYVIVQKVYLFLTHGPTVLFQPTIHDLSHACDWQREPLSNVERFTHAPSSTTTSGPMTTSGPIRQPLPIFALGSYKISQITLIYHVNKINE